MEVLVANVPRVLDTLSIRRDTEATYGQPWVPLVCLSETVREEC